MRFCINCEMPLSDYHIGIKCSTCIQDELRKSTTVVKTPTQTGCFERWSALGQQQGEQIANIRGVEYGDSWKTIEPIIKNFVGRGAEGSYARTALCTMIDVKLSRAKNGPFKMDTLIDLRNYLNALIGEITENNNQSQPCNKQ